MILLKALKEFVNCLYVGNFLKAANTNRYGFLRIHFFYVFGNLCTHAQLTFACSKSTIETQEKGVKYAQSLQNTRTTSLMSFRCFYC